MNEPEQPRPVEGVSSHFSTEKPKREKEKRMITVHYVKPGVHLSRDGLSHPGLMKCLKYELMHPDVANMVASTGRGVVSRNSSCPCGSGKRFKRCCGRR